MTGTSLVATMASRFNMDPAQFARTIRSTVMPSDHTDEQFAAFMMVAHQYGLNPITREIYAYPARKGGGINPVVSIDGWVNLVNSHPQCNGFEIAYGYDDKGKLASATCTMWRKDREHPIVVTEHLSECYRNTDPWNQMPKRMLRHKAFKEAARYAFGFSGFADEDEAQDAIATRAKPIELKPAPDDDLDAFVASRQPSQTSAEPRDTGTEAAGDSGGSQMEAASSPDSAALPKEAAAAAAEPLTDEDRPAEMKALAISAVLKGATNTSIPVDQRLATLEEAFSAFADDLDVGFIRQLVATAAKVVRGELKADKAKSYLENLK